MKSPNTRLLFALFFALTGTAGPAGASLKVILSWDPSVDASVVGYKIHYRDIATTNETVVDVGNTNAYVFPDLSWAKTYLFYMTSYDSAGLQSRPSEVVQFTMPLSALGFSGLENVSGQSVIRLHVDAVPDRPVVLQTSTNLVAWATLITGAVGQPIDHLATNRLSDPQRYYRSLRP